jgi:hypothetical protein
VRLRRWQLDHGGRGDLGQQAAEAHLEAGEAQDGHQLGHVLQVELVAGVVLGHQQDGAGAHADALDGGLGGLHAEGQEGVVEVVEAAREEVEVDRGELEAGVAQVGRAVEGRHVLLPLGAHPALDGTGVVEEVAFELQQGAGERGGEMGNHGTSRTVLGGRASGDRREGVVDLRGP